MIGETTEYEMPKAFRYADCSRPAESRILAKITVETGTNAAAPRSLRDLNKSLGDAEVAKCGRTEHVGDDRGFRDAPDCRDQVDHHYLDSKFGHVNEVGLGELESGRQPAAFQPQTQHTA